MISTNRSRQGCTEHILKTQSMQEDEREWKSGIGCKHHHRHHDIACRTYNHRKVQGFLRQIIIDTEIIN